MLRGLCVLLTLILFIGTVSADIYKYVRDDGVIVFTDIPDDGDVKIVAKTKVKKNRGKRETGYYANLKKYYPYMKKSAEEFFIDPELIKAIITVESRWAPLAVSPKGAMGLMQLMPLTAESLSVRNPFDPEENISGGIRYFRMLLDLFEGDLRKALAAYNAGPSRVKRNVYFPMGSETRDYIDKVLKIYGGEQNFKYVPLDRRLAFETIYKLVLDDGTVLFTNTPVSLNAEGF